MTTRTRIEAMREARLWVGQIIVPVVMLAASTLAIPEVRLAIADKATEYKWKTRIKLDSLKEKIKK